jgi:hypothetical protein
MPTPTGRKMSDETRAKMSAAHKRRSNQFQSKLRTLLIEQQLDSEMTSRCEHCTFSETGPARDVIKAFRLHRVQCNRGSRPRVAATG